jgi:hypothetical protein
MTLEIPVHVTAFYTALALLWMLYLSLEVVRLRWRHGVGLGDGGQPDLQAAVRIHANAAEYLPLGLVMLLVLELMAARLWVLHALGLALLVGRVAHCIGLRTRSGASLGRSVGMALSFAAFLGGAAALMAEAFLV